jgi:hypothetical protein
MYPLVPAELGRDFSLERVLTFGSIPLVWQADDPKSTLEAYSQLYVREEIPVSSHSEGFRSFAETLHCTTETH